MRPVSNKSTLDELIELAKIYFRLPEGEKYITIGNAKDGYVIEFYNSQFASKELARFEEAVNQLDLKLGHFTVRAEDEENIKIFMLIKDH